MTPPATDPSAGAAPELTAAVLAEPVTRALGVGHVDVVDWRVEPMNPGTGGATGGLYRVEGTASATEVPHAWAVVLKALRPQAGRLSTQGNVAAASGLEPHHYNYWRREALAYESGLLSEVMAIRAPRCFGVEERPDGAVWIWMESLDASAVKPPWPTERFANVARQLGRFNGAYVVGAAALPDYAWLSRGWLRSWLARWSTVTESALDEKTWADARVRRTVVAAGEMRARLRRLAAAHEALLGAIERLPQTVSHLDVFSRNVIFAPARCAHEAEEIALIDWAFVGLAALGEEVAQLVAGTVLFGDADRLAARDIGETAFDAYVDGLRDAGWVGDVEAVRLGYAAAASLRWGAFAVGNVLRTATADDERRARIEEESGKPLGATVASYTALATYLLELGDEAIGSLTPSRG